MKTENTPTKHYSLAACRHAQERRGMMSILLFRRMMYVKPLTVPERMADEATRDELEQALEGIATVFHFGHPARRMLIAFPQRGYTEKDTMDAIAKVAPWIRGGGFSCGNYFFSVARP